MKTPNRDLLVLVKDDSYDEDAMENELVQLNRLLIYSETLDNYCRVHEVFDMNRYKVISQPHALQDIISQQDVKSFVFICNKN